MVACLKARQFSIELVYNVFIRQSSAACLDPFTELGEIGGSRVGTRVKGLVLLSERVNYQSRVGRMNEKGYNNQHGDPHCLFALLNRKCFIRETR